MYTCVCCRGAVVALLGFSGWLCYDTDPGARNSPVLFREGPGGTPTAGAERDAERATGERGFHDQLFVQRTLAIVKPDAAETSWEGIEGDIRRAGFVILQKQTMRFTPQLVAEFYAEHLGKRFFEKFAEFMTSGRSIALVLAHDRAVSRWRQLIGPTNSIRARDTHPQSVRAKFGTDGQHNAVHGSDSSAGAEREIRMLFSDAVTKPLPIEEVYKSTKVFTLLANLSKNSSRSSVIWLPNWLVEL